MTIQEKLITWISEAEADFERQDPRVMVTRQEYVANRLISKQVTVFPIEAPCTLWTFVRLDDEDELLLCELHVTEVGRKGFWCSSAVALPYEDMTDFFDWQELGVTVFQSKGVAMAQRECVSLFI